ncbi:MAG: hypothetical protein AVO38_08065 [delta proteobacterium ML8_D]|nr:MAG: hypothetical protein AVO38_08065 [delta proteobacterium ML8_D]
MHFEKLEPGSEFLIALFANLKDNLLDYCVLRNYKSLPFSTGGSDLDILVAGHHFNKTVDLIKTLTRQYGGKIICETKADKVVNLSVCGFYDNTWWGIKFDLFSYVGTNGCYILLADELLARCFEYNGVMVANDRDGAVIAFLKELIGAGRTRKNYRTQALQAFSQERGRYLKSLSHYWGDEVYKTLLEPLLSGDLVDFKMAGKRLKREWLNNMFHRQPLQVARNRVVDFSFRVKRVFFPAGFSVAFIGTDGSGKSTIIEGIRPPLEAALHASLRYEHMRPNLFPSLSRLLGGAKT